MSAIRLYSLVTKTQDQVRGVLQEAKPQSAQQAYRQLNDLYSASFSSIGDLLTTLPSKDQTLTAAWVKTSGEVEQAQNQDDIKGAVRSYGAFFNMAQQVALQMASPVTSQAAQTIKLPSGATATRTPPVAAAAPPPPPTAEELLQQRLAKVGGSVVAPPPEGVVEGIKKGKISLQDARGGSYTAANAEALERWFCVEEKRTDGLPAALKGMLTVYEPMQRAGYKFLVEESEKEIGHPLEAFETLSSARVLVRQKDTRWFINSAVRFNEFGLVRLDRTDELDDKTRNQLDRLTRLKDAGWGFLDGGKKTQSSLVALWWLQDGRLIVQSRDGQQKRITNRDGFDLPLK